MDDAGTYVDVGTTCEGDADGDGVDGICGDAAPNDRENLRGGCSTDLDCNDKQFCNGQEICADGVCEPGMPLNCDDGVGCTDDACDEVAGCLSVPNDSVCGNGLFCDGAETCDAVVGCQAGSDPCAGSGCDELNDVCLVCESSTECDDVDVCTFDACIDNSCSNTPTTHADVASSDDCGPDGAVDLFDLSVFAQGFREIISEGCSHHNLDIKSSNACEPDGKVDLFDILAVLDAFAGTPNCPCTPTTDNAHRQGAGRGR